MKASQIIKIIEKHCPLAMQEEWDKSGLQIGDTNQDIHKIMIALNADLPTLQEAIDNDCQMLITHHPFLLNKIENIDKDSPAGAFIYQAILHNIVVYSSHTSMDATYMNEWLIQSLKVHDIAVGDTSHITRIALLDEVMSQDEFVDHVAKTFQISHLKYAGNAKTVKRIAVCGGSGSSFLPELYGKVDAFLTGDTKYHQAQEAIEKGILLIDINHHAEKIMISKFKELLEKEVNVEIIEGKSPDYYIYKSYDFNDSMLS